MVMINWLSHLFTPQKTNNFRAKLLHHDFLTWYLLCAVVVTFGFRGLQAKHGSVLGFATDISIEKLLILTNEEREKAGLQPLTHNEKLAQAAKDKARDMFMHNYWAHYSPQGKTPWDFIVGSGYQYEYAGENLAKNFLFSRAVVDAWMASPKHKENIVRKDYSEVGLAVTNGMLDGEETTLVVQMFGSPYYAAGSGSQAEQSTPEGSEADRLAYNTPDMVKNAQAPQLVIESPSDSGRVFQIQLVPMYLNINYIFIAVLILALIMDFYFAARLNLIHIKGKNILHILFLGFILTGTIMVIKGSII